VLLAGVSDLLEKIDLEPGRDFRVVTISFNEEEGPDLTKRKKNNYFKRLRREVDRDSWRFLTGSAASIRAVTEATGFRYKRTGKDFQHPAALIVLSPEGKIARYLYGVKFQPFDAKLAIYEASEGRSGPTINKILLFCFSYDPEGQTYTFNILKVTGTVTMVFAVMFLVFLLVTTRRHRRKKESKSQAHG
jgi:protein SCO1/2